MAYTTCCELMNQPVSVCCSGMEQLKEKQVDFTVQHRIALDLFCQICSTGKFAGHSQCVLDAVQLVTVTISNLQRLEEILCQTEAVNKDKVQRFQDTVKHHVYDLWRYVKQWLPSVLSVRFGDMYSIELAVSILLLKFSMVLELF